MVKISWASGHEQAPTLKVQKFHNGRGKVPKLFGRISGDIMLFVSSKRRRLEAQIFEFILIFIPSTTCEKTSFIELASRSFTNGFLGPKSFRDFRETGPKAVNQLNAVINN